MDSTRASGDNPDVQWARAQRRAAVAWGLWSLCLAFAVVAAAMMAVNWNVTPEAPGVTEAIYLLSTFASASVGAFLARRRPDNPLGWLFLGVGAVEITAGSAAKGYANYVLFTTPGAGPGGELAAWANAWSMSVSLALITFALLLYPTGRLPSPRWRPFAIGVVAVAILAVLFTAFKPGVMDGPNVPHIPNPLGVPALASVLRVAEFFVLALVAAWLIGAASLIVRFRRSADDERQQVKWLLFPSVTMASAFAAAGTLNVVFGYSFTAVNWLFLLGIIAGIGVPIGAACGILKYRLLDIDLVIRHSVVYGALWLAITVAYLAGLAALGVTAAGQLPVGLAIVLTIAATLVFPPVIRLVDRIVGRWLFGEHADHYELLTEFGQTLERVDEPAELGPQIADTVRHALDLRWARVLLRWGEHRLELVGESGQRPAHHGAPAAAVPLVAGGVDIGAIECGPKISGQFSDRDHDLLRTLARQAALGFHNAHLAAELAARLDEIRRQADELLASRTRIVHAQDTERRRLERDLHDGVQQDLVSLVMKLQLARKQLHRDQLTDTTLTELQTEARQTLADLRELARGIHPPVLTDRGIVAALETRAAQLPISVRIETDPALRERRFATALETAAYFCCTEAMTNTLKHANAATSVIQITADDEQLIVQITDDGKGFNPATATGTGLTAMRDRLESLGGRLAITSQPGRGTRITGTLPATLKEPTDA